MPPAPVSFRMLLALLALLASSAAPAHFRGLTDTAIEIAAPGVRIVYTLPADDLLELADTASAAPPLSPGAYSAAIVAGWRVGAAGRACALTRTTARHIEELEAYQYVLELACRGPLDDLEIAYGLFDHATTRHENFTRVFIADRRMHWTFTMEKRTLAVPVAALLADWRATLAPAFTPSDLNRNLARDAATNRPPRVDAWAADPAFVRLGFEHILGGPDHLAFVIALLLVPARLGELVAWISTFTVAHSLTLALACLGMIDLPPAVTESLIALTVLAVGIENLAIIRGHAHARRRRITLVFLFGLVHGVGLSYQLATALDAPARDSVGRLLLFNLGVELGQLAVVALTWWPLRAAMRLGGRQHVPVAASLAISTAGLCWFVSRLT